MCPEDPELSEDDIEAIHDYVYEGDE